MRPEDVQLGMRVRVRDWDDMASEAMECKDGTKFIETNNGFGERLFSGNRTSGESCYFVEKMRPLCGKEFVITKISGRSLYGLDTGYIIEPWMVSCPEEESVEPVDQERLFTSLFGEEVEVIR